MDAVTLNCPSCGAAVAANSLECAFCHVKLATVACPSCFGFVFAGAKFCDHCGAKIVAPDDKKSTRKCPRGCGEMHTISFGDVQLDECLSCGGYWLTKDAFERLCADREKQAPILNAHHVDQASGDALRPVETVRYVPCPECGKLMNRTNFAHSSGVIVDTCGQHGVWFDADELRRVIEFIRAGGLEVQRKKEIETLADERRLKAVRDAGTSAAVGIPLPQDGGGGDQSTSGSNVLSILFSTTKIKLF